MARLFQFFGVVFVLSLVGGAIAGFLVLKDRVRVVIAADEVAAGPDPQALLRDDVQVVARDVAALQAALAQNFERLATALEERANARHAEVQALRPELASLRQQCAALQAGQAALRERLDALPLLLAAAGPGTAGAPASADSAPTAPVTAAPDPVAAAAGEPPPATAQASPTAVPPKTTGFLSFAVPSAVFRFDQAQDYVLVPELSRVGFDAKSTLHDFTGVTSKLRGSFRADFDDPEGAWTGEVVVSAATLLTGVEGRDEGLREHLAVAQFPDLSFRIARFVPAAGGIDVGKQTARGEVLGTMTIRGQARAVRMPITVEVDPQKRVVLAGQMPLKLSDHGVPVPSQLGVINMQDEVVVWIALRARLQTGGRK